MENFFKNEKLRHLIQALGIALPMLFVAIGVFLIGGDDGLIARINFDDIYGIMALASVLLGAISILVDAVFLILSLVKRKNILLKASVTSLVFIILIWLLTGIFDISNGGLVLLLVLSILLHGVGILYSILSYRYFDETTIEEEEIQGPRKKRYLLPFIVDSISLASLLLVFFIPMFEYTRNGETVKIILIHAITGTGHIEEFVGFIILLIMFGIGFGKLLDEVRYFMTKNIRFVEKSNQSSTYFFAVSVTYFVIATTLVFGYSFSGNYPEIKTLSFIPVFITSFLTVAHSILNSWNDFIPSKKKKTIHIKWLVLVFVTGFTLITIASLGLNLITIISNGETIVNCTGFDILKDPEKNGKGFQAIAFVVYSILVISGVLYVLTITACFSKSKEAKRIGLTSIILNLSFVLIIGLFGKYYEISSTISREQLIDFINSKYPGVLDFLGFDMDILEVKSQTYIMIFVATGLGVLTLLVKPFTRADEYLDGEISLMKTEDEPIEVSLVNASSESTAPIGDEKKMNTLPKAKGDFDACPSFTELDSKMDLFSSEMEKRREKLFSNPTLPDLVQYIVDYAREDRKHLSYTNEQIASFIAGLGATKLTILQGMSGTGKTSLPLIFLKALMGNCELIAVESSWKDKNELLGYYNEFSKTFTPKKFTRDLYKAGLNSDVITFIVLDEMNLSRIEYYFSDFLSLMEYEPEDRKIQLLNVKLYNTYDNEHHSYRMLEEDHTLRIPANVWFIGTANRDESTFEISDKVYDRAHTINFNTRAKSAKSFNKPMEERYLSFSMFDKLLTDAKENMSFELEEFSYVKELEELLKPYNISFGNRIYNQITAYVRIYASCFGDPEAHKDEALQKILLSKVVSKLEFKAVEDKMSLARKFEKLGLYDCADFIKGLNGDF